MEPSTLVDRLSQFSSELTTAERENLKFLLSMAAGGLLSGHARTVAEPLRKAALTTAQHSLPKLHGALRPAFDTGVVFCGRGPFFSADDLAVLDRESLAYRARAERFQDHYVASGAPVARELALSQSVSDFLAAKVGPVLPTYKANYLYYDEPGLGIDPHVDKDEFSLNVLTMLEHRAEPRQSELILYPPDQEALRIHLDPGESLVFFADSVTHQRTRTVSGEAIRLVSFGYRTIGSAA
ncbi:hypothetical protein [Actinacidiphila acididurans]|uniref:Fe2OG dioxygenase domain-containing protein n=1 Tax=Actinacidiphila acididurans TaxID=2784346 RepID=A0ABS2TP06_9ACTN|nr:hypothetical protein [Actinacidiphila acididurans]MBM9504221.1 hypothetical protein [Actinacidiphila acididurans]